MMIEGTVEVAGTVQIDKSNEIRNALINARRAYEDGNIDESYKLYSEVLSIDPDNAEAVVCKGLASSRGSTVASPKYSEAINAFVRGIELKHEQVGDTKDFFGFVLGAQNTTYNLMLRLKNLFVGNYNDAVAAPGSLGSQKRADAKAKMQNNAMNLTEMTCVMVATIFALVKDYRPAYDAFTDYFDKQEELLLKGAEEFLTSAKLGTEYGADKRGEFLKKIQTEKIYKYWREHPEEYQKYLENLERIKSLEEQKSLLQKEHEAIGAFEIEKKRELTKKIKSVEKSIEQLRNT